MFRSIRPSVKSVSFHNQNATALELNVEGNEQSWEKEVNEAERHEFKQLASQITHVNQNGPQKNQFESAVNKVYLHIFSDASLEAMCMVAYLREPENREITFLIRKCRKAPM